MNKQKKHIKIICQQSIDFYNQQRGNDDKYFSEI